MLLGLTDSLEAVQLVRGSARLEVERESARQAKKEEVKERKLEKMMLKP